MQLVIVMVTVIQRIEPNLLDNFQTCILYLAEMSASLSWRVAVEVSPSGSKSMSSSRGIFTTESTWEENCGDNVG